MSARLFPLVTLAALAVVTSACSSGPGKEPSGAEAAAEDTCGIRDLQDRVGQTLDVQLLQVFENAVPSHRVRVLTPESAATMDYVPERANIKTDKANVITSISCG